VSGVVLTALQSRDPFSGDCDVRPEAGVAPEDVLACRAETRSQGIATQLLLRQPIDWHPLPLQSRDPFSGDCDDEGSGAEGGRGERTGLQSRDPFSGDCDASISSAHSARRSNLQSRDPFSGDCDTLHWGHPAPLRWTRLAEPRPVLRGLRPGDKSVRRKLTQFLACRAETRSQGIATKRKSKGGSWLQYLFPGDCNATLDTSGNLHYTWGKRGRLPATRRPVCRGLRHYKG
jgi:hypothetical protein